MKKVAVVMALIIFWFGCGFLGAGMEIGYWKNSAQYWKNQDAIIFKETIESCKMSARGTALGVLITGPVGLTFAAITTGVGYHGITWRLP